MHRNWKCRRQFGFKLLQEATDGAAPPEVRGHNAQAALALVNPTGTAGTTLVPRAERAGLRGARIPARLCGIYPSAERGLASTTDTVNGQRWSSCGGRQPKTPRGHSLRHRSGRNLRTGSARQRVLLPRSSPQRFHPRTPAGLGAVLRLQFGRYPTCVAVGPPVAPAGGDFDAQVYTRLVSLWGGKDT